jgi:hypothetical protein
MARLALRGILGHTTEVAMKVQGKLDGAIDQLTKAHQAAGSASLAIRHQAEPFYDRVARGGAFDEMKLKLKLAVSPSSRDALSQLWRLVFDTPKSELARNDKLQAWVADNKPLIGWMSKDTQKMLADVVGQRGHAKAIDDGINRAEDALAKAFGTGTVTTDERKVLSTFAHEAHIIGAVIEGFAHDVDKLASSTATLFVPGAKAALSSLKAALTNPDATVTERRDALQAFRGEHPRLVSVLDQHIFARMGHDLSVADWSDGRFQAAEDAVRKAFTRDPA